MRGDRAIAVIGFQNLARSWAGFAAHCLEELDADFPKTWSLIDEHRRSYLQDAASAQDYARTYSYYARLLAGLHDEELTHD